jgi:hypothetical protein
LVIMIIFTLANMASASIAAPVSARAAAKQEQHPGQQQQQHAGCRLLLRGHHNGSLGVAAAQLACSSPSGPVPVFVNSTHLGQYAAAFTGVTLVANEHCATQAAANSVSKDWGRPYGLLFFCSNVRLTLHQPVVQGVALYDRPSLASKDAEQTALLAFGGSIDAEISGGEFVGNTAGPAMLAMQNASLSVARTVVHSNVGYRGVGLMALDNSVVNISNSAISNMTSDAGSVYATHSAHVVMVDSMISDNAAATDGAGIHGAGNSTVLATNTSIIRNSAAGLGAGAYSMLNAKVSL